MKGVPFRQDGERVILQLFDERDTPWIAAIVDELERAVGRPWRELLQRIDRLPERSSPARRAAVVGAMQGFFGGRVDGAVDPKQLRRVLFGSAAVDVVTRDERIAAAAQALQTTPELVADSVWRDLPAERTVLLPHGRPSELAIAAEANLCIIRRALLRCHELRLEVSGNARGIVRTAALRGLLSVAHRQGDRIALCISGPLAMFHRTTVYGRALGSLISQLAWCEQFLLEARCNIKGSEAMFRLQPPLLLPPSSRPQKYDSAVEARFERDMARGAPHWRVMREPCAVDAGTRLIFPDFLIEHRMNSSRRWWVEIVGYWTAEYLAHKLAAYRAANLPNVILCVDAKRSLSERELPRAARIVRFKKWVTVREVLSIIDAANESAA